MPWGRFVGELAVEEWKTDRICYKMMGCRREWKDIGIGAGNTSDLSRLISRSRTSSDCWHAANMNWNTITLYHIQFQFFFSVYQSPYQLIWICAHFPLHKLKNLYSILGYEKKKIASCSTHPCSQFICLPIAVAVALTGPPSLSCKPKETTWGCVVCHAVSIRWWCGMNTEYQKIRLINKEWILWKK